MNQYLGLYGFNFQVLVNLLYWVQMPILYYLWAKSTIEFYLMAGVVIGLLYRILIISSVYSVLTLTYKYNISLTSE